MKITQKNKILNHLRKYNGLTSYEAFHMYRITRLAARIFNLREDGHVINTEKVFHDDGTYFANYHLIKEAE